MSQLRRARSRWPGFALGGFFAAAALAAASPALAQCANPPVQVSIKFDATMPADVTFGAVPAPTPIKVRVQIENCSGGSLLTTAGFSSSDFFRRLYFTDPKGGTVINKSEETLHGYSPPLFCLSRSGVLQSPAIPVFPVEVLGPNAGPPAVQKFFREYVIDDVRTLYDLTLPGHYSVKAVIPLVTFGSAAVIGDCDQFEGTMVANVTALAGRQAFTVESNTLELVILGPPMADNSSITGTGPVVANGAAASTVTITLKDAADDPVPNVTPAFSASGSGNTLGACSATNASGESTCSLRSTTAEVKTLSITSPVTKVGGTVSFTAGPASGAGSTIAGTSPVVADGVAASTVTITLKDASNRPVPGATPTFSATGSNNTLGPCSATDASGVSTCALKSTKAEVKTLAIVTPVSKTGGTVTFVPVPPSATTSTISITGSAGQVGVVPPPGQAGGAQVSMSGSFTFNGPLDLKVSSVTIDFLLGELTQGGAGELLKGTGGVTRLPVVLPPNSGSTANAAVFTNPSTQRPTFRVEVRLRDAVKRLFDFTIKIDRASIPVAPKLCAGATPRTDLVTSLTIKPASSGPAVVTTTQPWRCRGSSVSLP